MPIGTAETAISVRRLAQLLRMDLLTQCQPHRITPTQFYLMTIVAENNGTVNMSQVAAKIGANAASVCESLRTLERLGFLTSVSKLFRDGRMKILSITSKGLNLLDRMSDPDKDTLHACLLEVLSMEEREKFCTVVDKLNAEIERSMNLDRVKTTKEA